MRALVAVLAALLVVAIGGAPAAATPGLPGHPEWWFDAWNVPALWSGGARGQGITIAEIDSGVNASLPELSASTLPGTDFGAPGGNGQVDRDIENFGHGTAMASIMVAHGGGNGIQGIAPDAKLLPIAIPLNGTSDATPGDDHLLDAIRWAADHKVNIITMSLGSDYDTADGGRSCPEDEQDAVDYALSKNVILVASSGNSGDKGSPIDEPAVCLGVISVGAIDQSRTVAPFSSRHPYLTVTAPGVNVPSLGSVGGELYYGDGTSQAAAVTSGGLAVIWSKHPKLNASQVTARLLATLDNRKATRDPAYGFGMINIGAAVNANVPADAPNAVQDGAAPFVARDSELAKASPKVKHTKPTGPVPGHYSVASQPSPLTSGAGLIGLMLGTAGLITLAALIVSRRRRA